ncbi:MAG TPA: hypothetical protein ENN22_09875 [bacterium]|nr:hypothetical protein [bacterium]
MKKLFTGIFFILIIAAVIFSCADDKNPLPSVSHPEGWNTVNAENFHGAKVLDTGYSSCKSCHGTELKGGKSGVSCYNSSCHSTYPHRPEWGFIGNSENHGNYIKQNDAAIENCKKCHGDALTGGKSGVSCFDCHQYGTLPL